MEGQPGWSTRYAWLDGIAAIRIDRTSPQSLRIAGNAYVANGDRWTLRPVQADLVRAPGTSTLRFASSDAEIAYPPGRGREVIPPEPATWATASRSGCRPDRRAPTEAAALSATLRPSCPKRRVDPSSSSARTV